MSDSDFGFDGGQADLDFGFNGSSSSSDDEEVISTPPVDEDVLVEALIDDSSGDDDVVATAEIVNRKCRRRRYTIQEKLMLLRQAHQQMNNGASQRSVCNSININRKLINDWNKQFPQLIDAMNNKAKSLCKGMQSCLFPFSDSLLSFIFELREQGMAVNTSMILMKAAKISRQFREKSREAQISCVQRFVKAQGLVHQLGTHESQRAPEETQTEVLDFMGVICLKLQLQCRSKAFILNMDQTPIPFTFNSKSTLEVVGARTVHVRKSTNDTKRATAAITITASGKMLPPLLFFKGAKNGRIVKKEFPTFDKSMYYACQENAWMDERVMLLWVEKVLKPYVESAPEGIVPLLLLDSYHCHVMASLVNEIQDLGVEVEHIPGSCTYLCQPVDIGINKPYKKHMRRQWELWMISEGMVEGTTSPPSCEQIGNWAKYANETMSEVNIRNAWKQDNTLGFLMNYEKISKETY